MEKHTSSSWDGGRLGLGFLSDGRECGTGWRVLGVGMNSHFFPYFPFSFSFSFWNPLHVLDSLHGSALWNFLARSVLLCLFLPVRS